MAQVSVFEQIENDGEYLKLLVISETFLIKLILQNFSKNF